MFFYKIFSQVISYINYFYQNILNCFIIVKCYNELKSYLNAIN